MNWFKMLKEANMGHGDTLHGQMKAIETSEIKKTIASLKTRAIVNQLGVLPRWAGEIKRAILLLPPTDKIPLMSMYELNNLKKRIANIQEMMDIYSASRLVEITGRAYSS